MKERLISALLSQEHKQETELKEIRRKVEDLKELLHSHFPSSIVQLTGEGEGLAIAGKETTIKLTLSSQAASLLTFPIEQLSCQFTDPHHQHIRCRTASTQPARECTVKYTPTLRGPHQLRIAIRDYDISGSPLKVRVILPPEMNGVVPVELRGVVQYTITKVLNPWGLALSKSGEVVVSESGCIGVYNIDGEKIKSFGFYGSSRGKLQHPSGIAFTFDNHILIADEFSHQIHMFTLENRFVKSVGQEGNGPLQFNRPLGIAVHPSGKVLVADSRNFRVQVLHADISFSHLLEKAPGELSCPHCLSIDSNGVVYVTDKYNHCVQLFSVDGQFISSFGSDQLYRPTGICIDSTNTLYITDENNHVSVYTSSGQFIKCFGTQESGEEKLNGPKGIAIDNTTGALYVCDIFNDRVVVY